MVAQTPIPAVLQSTNTGAPHYPAWLRQMCRQLMLKEFRAMNVGRLTMHLPDEETLVFGTTLDARQQAPAEVWVRNIDFFVRLVLFGHVGAGEAYMKGDWDTPDIAAVVDWVILNTHQSPFLEGHGGKVWFTNMLGWINRFSHWRRPNSVSTSVLNIQEHYDLSNAFFALFLDPTMTYSSALFEHAGQSLEEAQIAKYDALCKKLRLKSTDRLLEIGSGWGGFAIYAASRYGCQVKTITISQQQFDLAKERIAAAGMCDKVTIELKDYRHLTDEPFDKIASIEMVEALGEDYMDVFFGACARLLKPEGLLAIQMITCPDSRYDILKGNVDFIQKHIFPGTLLPSLGRVNQAFNRTSDVCLYELSDLGLHYAKTLSLWFDAFCQQHDAVLALGFDEPFVRKWAYYLKYCESAFRMRHITVVQALYSRPNNLMLS